MSAITLLCFILALAGAACSLLAALGTGFLGKDGARRFYRAGYFLMFVSIGVFILKGFLA